MNRTREELVDKYLVEGLKQVAPASQVARHLIERKESLSAYQVIGGEITTMPDELLDVPIYLEGFHPNGTSGCILADDKSIFSIRCNHLMWAEGLDEIYGDALFVYGNHKGILVGYIIHADRIVIDE